MAIRMRTGTMVQATSSQVWCVVFEGTGFLASLKRTDDDDDQRQHEHADHRDQPDEPGVKDGQVATDFGHHALHAHFPGGRRARAGRSPH